MAGSTHRRTFATIVLGVALAGAAVVPSAAVFASSASTARLANTCDGVRGTIVGTNGPDEINGTSGRDVIVAKKGNDDIEGKGGNDLICAGPGRDDGPAATDSSATRVTTTWKATGGPIASAAARVGTRARAAEGTTPA